MARFNWYAVLVGVCLAAVSAQGQVLRVVSAHCEISSLIEIPCLPPIEIHRVSPPSFTSFADSVTSDLSDCNPRAISVASVEQITTVLPDSAYIHEAVSAELSHGAVVVPGQAALAHSDASIVFRVDAGRQYSYALDVALSSEIFGGGTAIANFSLSRTGPGGGAIHSFRVQSGPGLPMQSRGQWQPPHGILVAGDYAIEAHVSADGHPGGVPSAEQWMVLKLRDVTAVAPTTWGLVKSLYR